VTLLSPDVLFWVILECSKLQFFPIHFYRCPILTQIQDYYGFFFFHPLNIVELSLKKMFVQEASLEPLRSTEEFFLKINKNYFGHICPNTVSGLK